MSVGNPPAPRGDFAVVGGPSLGEKQRRELVDEDRLTEEMREGLEADDFIIYGKASVEQYDDDEPSQKLNMETFGREMDSFFENGIISRRHKDIPVGEPLREWTLEDDTEMVVGDEVLEFGAGDTLETGIADDELWIVARVYNDSELAKDTRVGAMTGELNGFSVTVFVKEWEETAKGQNVTDLDWHSVTIGADDQIKNSDSRFGVAEFKMFERMASMDGVTSKQAERAAVEILDELPTNMSTSGDSNKGFWERVREKAAQKAEDEEQDGPEDSKAEDGPEDSKAGGDPEDGPEDEKADGDGSGDDPEDEKGDYGDGGDVETVLKKVEEDIGEEEAQMLQQQMEGPPGVPGGEGAEPPAEEEEERPPAEGELKADELAAKLSEAGFVTEDRLAEKLDERLEGVMTSDDVAEKLDERLPDDVASKADVKEVMETAEDVITDVVPTAQKAAAEDAAEETAEKMATGSTPDPSAGTANDERDYMDEIKSRFGSNGGN